MRIERVGIHRSVEQVFPPERLEESLADVPVPVEIVDDGLETLDGIVTFEHRDGFVGLRWVHTILAGVNRYPVSEFDEHGVTLTNSTGIHGDAAGQTVMAYVLSLARGLHRYRDSQSVGEWNQLSAESMERIDGEEICVIGLGTLGSGIATYAQGMGMDVIGVRQSGIPAPRVDRVYTPDDLLAAVSSAKFVAVAVPLNANTEGLIDEQVFSEMRDDAYFINVARGPVVREDALIDAIRSGSIAGAALDVFETEPLPRSSPLWTMEDVIITPHVSSLFPAYHRSVADIVRTNLKRLRAGDEPVNKVV